MKYFYLFISLFFSFTKANAQSIIPKPNSIKEFYKLRFNFSKINIVCSPEIEAEANYLKTALEEKNIPVFINSKVSGTQNIELIIAKEKFENQEAYKLISNQNIKIEAKTSAGIFYGIQSLLQLIGTQKNNFSLYETEIEDAPQFSWRGMHLDVSRHFFPVSFIKKYIDILALHKMNTFHWHLTDDQGWRIEIKKYPLLTEIGSKRKETIVDKNFNPYIGDGKKVEGFYTQDEIKEIIKYAAERYITIVPEIEMPGHCVAAISAYPFLGCLGKKDEVLTKWGVSENVLCTKDSTLKFMYDVLDEVMNLFPSKIIHIGGDEVPKSQWKKCTVCQQKIKELKLKDEHELQSYFIKKIDSFVVSKGKNIIGWDEILEGGLAENAKVMSWRGEAGGIEAANQKHDVVMCPGSHCYFDHYQGNKKTEPLAIGGFTTLKKVYSYQPIPQKINEENKKYILGAQGNVWTEYIPTTEHVMYMALPRLCALSEVLWSKDKNKNYEEFTSRLMTHFKLLNEMNINYATSIFDVNATSISNDTKSIKLLLNNDLNGLDIRYTLDGSEPNANSKKYKEPILISKSTLLKAALFDENNKKGNVFSQQYNINLATGKKIEFTVSPNESYNNGGAQTLVDGVIGDLPWSGNQWLGWRKEDTEMNLDLGEITTFNKIKISFLKAPESWIHLPSQLYIKISNDGIRYDNIKSINEFDVEKIALSNQVFFEGKQQARYIKIFAPSRHQIPLGFDGAGEAAWMFCSEIIVE